MPPARTLTAANLEALGAARLAALLLEISAGNAAAKTKLRLALAGNAGPAEAAREVAKRLASLARGRSFIDDAKIKPLAAELEAHRRAILDLVAPGDPRHAFELTWQLVECAESVLGRSHDETGRLSDVFHAAVQALGKLAQAAGLDPHDLAGRAFAALQRAQYDEWKELVPVLAPCLGAAGLDRLKGLMAAWQAEPAVTPPEHARRVIGWSSSGKIYADQIENSHRRHTAAFVLKQIADAAGDADGYAAQFDTKARSMPGVAADIAQRLLQAGRPQAAWEALEAVPPANRGRAPLEWDQAWAEALAALGRPEAARVFQWERFLVTLDPLYLRAYLSKMPAFEDVEAEQRGLTQAAAAPDVHPALAFLVQWPDLNRASALVLARAGELDGDRYEVLSPAADALEYQHPLAALLLRRVMIDFILGAPRPTRFKHAAHHLRACAGLAARVTAFGGIPDHATYEQALRAAHGKRVAFWSEAGKSR